MVFNFIRNVFAQNSASQSMGLDLFRRIWDFISYFVGHMGQTVTANNESQYGRRFLLYDERTLY